MPARIAPRLTVIALALAIACGADNDPKPSPVPTPPPPQPAVLPRVAAIGFVEHFSPEVQRAFDPDGFEPMPAPGPSDWLAQHPETPQTYDQYARTKPNLPDAQRRVLYLLPLGEFPSTAPSVDALGKIVRAFYTLEVRVLPAVALRDVKAKTRKHPEDRQLQLLAPDVLRWLTARVPDDAYGLVAITMTDLYPQESWNFVFGMASLRERVGVQSFARQDPAFFGEKRDAGWEQLALRRATWTMVHELAHMFGLPHCTYFSCVVAGSNHQAEADRRPLHPCPVCLRKLHHAIGFDPAKREEDLAAVLRELGIADEAAWSERRARWIRTGQR